MKSASQSRKRHFMGQVAGIISFIACGGDSWRLADREEEFGPRMGANKKEERMDYPPGKITLLA